MIELIVLDIDNTLIHKSKNPEFEINGIGLRRYPYLDYFLRKILYNFDGIGIYSAGEPLYVDSVINKIFPKNLYPDFVLDSSHCLNGIKFLQTVFDLEISQINGWDFSNTIMIDDMITKIHPILNQNVISPNYFGDLKQIADYLVKNKYSRPDMISFDTYQLYMNGNIM